MEREENYLIRRTISDSIAFFVRVAGSIAYFLITLSILIVYLVNGPRWEMTLSCFLVGTLGIIFLSVEGVLLFYPFKREKGHVARLRGATRLSLFSSVLALLGGVAFCLCPVFFETGNELLNDFILVYGIVHAAIFLLLFFFDLWHQSWMKQNPHRYGGKAKEEETLEKEDPFRGQPVPKKGHGFSFANPFVKKIGRHEVVAKDEKKDDGVIEADYQIKD